MAINNTVILTGNLGSEARIKVTGSLSYRPFEVVNGEGQVITKKEASVIANQIELAALPKKAKLVPNTA